MEMSFSDSRPPVPADSSPGLRPLGWRELCARLVAAHDTRGVLAEAGRSPGTGRSSGTTIGGSSADLGHVFSFHESAATLLRSVETEAEGLVNPASSANGNDAEGKKEFVPNAALQCRPDENSHD